MGNYARARHFGGAQTVRIRGPLRAPARGTITCILVTLTADRMNELGMVVDFVEVKRVLFGALEEAWDHRTLLFRDDPLSGQLSALLTDGSVRVVPFNPTAENMAAYLAQTLFPKAMAGAGMKGVRVSRVVVYETEGSQACWSAD